MPVTVLVNLRGREYVDFDILVSRSAVEREMRMGEAQLCEGKGWKDENWSRIGHCEYTVSI